MLVTQLSTKMMVNGRSGTLIQGFTIRKMFYVYFSVSFASTNVAVLTVLQQTLTMEKFCLKWNDFQTNVSKTFSSLRQEEHLFDVTLVSDDEQHIAAHKLVLSVSSEFFKNIIKRAQHSNPMIYLSGFKSRDLFLVMDYIYQGEVQILQTDLDRFLNVAQQLKIEGLIGGDNEFDGTHTDEHIKEDIETSLTQEESSGETILDQTEENKYVAPRKKIPRADRSVAVVSSASNMEAKTAVDDLVEKTENGWMCKACGKTTKTSDIRRHAEIHIEGLSFDCHLCGKTFRSRNSFKTHKSVHHKN